MPRWPYWGAVCALAALGAPLASACGSQADTGDAGADGAAPADGGTGAAVACGTGRAFCGDACIDVSGDDKNCGACSNVCMGSQHCAAGSCQESKIQHVVLIVQENHTFDAYFGKYCQAPAGSNPTCTEGPACCEHAPAQEPHGAAPTVLDDSSNFDTDRNHEQKCELQQIHGGDMSGFVTGSAGASTCLGLGGVDCASANNWALADRATVGAYWALADGNALADRYFQPIAGGTSSNNMYFAAAHFEFVDNDVLPSAIGSPSGCLSGLCLDGKAEKYTGRETIADVLIAAGKTFAVYADGFAHAKAAAPSCEGIPGDCKYSEILHPIASQGCKYDASDIPFAYYAQFADGPLIKDYADLEKDIAAGALPSFAYVKAREFHNEHPNVSTITDGIAFVTSTIQLVEGSSYADSTLVLLTWDEGGGFFDHVPPPAGIDVDTEGGMVPYGTRVPLLAIGPFARKGAVSHVQMEHSSIVAFLEYNFAGPTGQLAANDTKVNNLGSLLDPAKTGIRIPEAR